MLEEILALIFGGDIIRGIGKYSRFVFFKIFQRNIKKFEFFKKLEKIDSEGMYNRFNHDVYNIIVGYFVLILIVLIIGTFFI